MCFSRGADEVRAHITIAFDEPAPRPADAPCGSMRSWRDTATSSTAISMFVCLLAPAVSFHPPWCPLSKTARRNKNRSMEAVLLHNWTGVLNHILKGIIKSNGNVVHMLCRVSLAICRDHLNVTRQYLRLSIKISYPFIWHGVVIQNYQTRSSPRAKQPSPCF